MVGAKQQYRGFKHVLIGEVDHITNFVHVFNLVPNPYCINRKKEIKKGGRLDYLGFHNHYHHL